MSARQGSGTCALLIDKQGGVDILDCEAISRVVSDLLDEADPIEGAMSLRSAPREPSARQASRGL